MYITSRAWVASLASFLAFRVSSVVAEDHDHAKTFQARNRATIQKIYNLTVYPNNAAVIEHGASAVPAGLFNTNATGRIAPVGEFFGFTDSFEYFFGLAPIPSASQGYAAITKATLASFISECAEVAASVVYLRFNVVNPGSASNGAYLSTIKQVAFWKFDASGAVLQYDAWIPNLAPEVSKTSGGADFTSPAVQNATIQGVCAVIQQRCVGANQQYKNTADCIQRLSSKPFGSWDEVWGDNVPCRIVHSTLALLRPDFHCPHCGPTGGGKCIAIDYNNEYFNDQLLFGKPAGKTFVCPT